MDFGKKLREQREAKGMSQSKLAKAVGVHQSIIGRYEREEAKPTIDVVKRLAHALDTTVGYLLGEEDEAGTFKNTEMFKRFKDVVGFSQKEQEHILFALDAMITKIKLKSL